MIKGAGGFSVVELMITVAIIGMLASIAIPNYQYMVQRAQMASLESTLLSVQEYLPGYYAEYNSYPVTSNMPWAAQSYFLVPQVDSTYYTPCTSVPSYIQDLCEYIPQLNSLPPNQACFAQANSWSNTAQIVYESDGTHYKIWGMCAVSEWANQTSPYTDPGFESLAIAVSDDFAATSGW